jgi:diketogulonate reductase-like aldo/keto reductase
VTIAFQRLALGLTVERRPVAILKEPYLASGRFIVDKPLSDDMFPTWKKLEELVDKGKIKNVGVCKYVF